MALGRMSSKHMWLFDQLTCGRLTWGRHKLHLHEAPLLAWWRACRCLYVSGTCTCTIADPECGEGSDAKQGLHHPVQTARTDLLSRA